MQGKGTRTIEGHHCPGNSRISDNLSSLQIRERRAEGQLPKPSQCGWIKGEERDKQVRQEKKQCHKNLRKEFQDRMNSQQCKTAEKYNENRQSTVELFKREKILLNKAFVYWLSTVFRDHKLSTIYLTQCYFPGYLLVCSPRIVSML